jgi:hypothetical protein
MIDHTTPVVVYDRGGNFSAVAIEEPCGENSLDACQGLVQLFPFGSWHPHVVAAADVGGKQISLEQQDDGVPQSGQTSLAPESCIASFWSAQYIECISLICQAWPPTPADCSTV